MKKILIITLALLSLIFALTSCEEGEIPDGMKYGSDTGLVDYTLFVPMEWVLDNTAPAKVSGAHVSDNDRTSVNVQKLNYTDNQSFFADFKAGVEKKFKDVSVINEGEDYLIDGLNAKKYALTGTFADGNYIKYEVYSVVNNGGLYAITFVYYGAKNGDTITYTDEKHAENVKKIVDTFKFSEKGASSEPVYEEKDTPENMKCASDTDIVDYKLFIPSKWTVEKTSGTVSAGSYYTANGGINLNVMQWNVSSYDYEVWWIDYENQLLNFFSDVKVTTYGKDEEGKDIKCIESTVAGKKAQEYNFTAKLGDKPYTYKVIGIMNNASIYIMTFTIEGVSTFDGYSNDVEKIIDNFKFN